MIPETHFLLKTKITNRKKYHSFFEGKKNTKVLISFSWLDVFHAKTSSRLHLYHAFIYYLHKLEFST